MDRTSAYSIIEELETAVEVMFDISWENAFMFEVISEMFGDCVMVVNA